VAVIVERDQRAAAEVDGAGEAADHRGLTGGVAGDVADKLMP